MNIEVNFDNLGRCYELSFKYLVSHPDWKLAHGYITNRLPPFQTIDHAWCVKDDIVHDEIFEMDFESNVYKGLFNCEVEKIYTYDEAMQKYNESDSHVMWHEVKKLKSDKYYDKEGKIKPEYKIENG